MYKIELVRHLCEEIHEAVWDSDREQELLYLLQAVMNEDQEQIRIRTALLNAHGLPSVN